MPFDNILEFVEGPFGLYRTLLPVQRFILKLYYGIELDASERQIPIYDHFQERLRYNLSETDYLEYLYGEGRCNVSNQSSLPRSGLVLAAGRRTGKTTLAELITSYTVIQMLQMGNPHAAFGFNSAAQHIVTACYIGHNTDLSKEFLSRITNHVVRCPELQASVFPNTGGNSREIRFLTPEGKRLGLTHGNLSVLAVDPRPRIHASARSMLIFDELAYMPEEQEVFNANIPTIRPPGSYMLLSTPRRSEGAFYNQFRHAMLVAGPSEAPLALQIPTWEMAPNMGPHLRQRFEENPTQFYVEYGAQWVPRNQEVHIEIRV